MTITQRNITTAALNGLLIILIIFCLYTFFSVADSQFGSFQELRDQFLGDSNGISLLLYGLQAVSLVILGIIAQLIFRKNMSPELLFFTCFLLFSGLDILKMVNGITILQQYPLLYQIMITKILYFGLLISMGFLFVSGLFLCGLQSQRMSLFFVLVLMLGLFLISILPVDISILKINMVHTVGFEWLFFVLAIVLAIGSGLNFLFGSIHNQNNQYIPVALFTFAAGIGRLGLFYVGNQVLYSLFFVILIISSIFFCKRVYRIYLWI